MSALEHSYQVELNETAFAEAKTISDVRNLLRQPPAAAPNMLIRAGPNASRCGCYDWPFTTRLVWPATQILGHPKIIGRENLKKC